MDMFFEPSGDWRLHMEDDLMIDIPFNKDFSEQMERTGNGEYPSCIICGRGIRVPRRMVHVHDGFASLVSEQEAQELNASGHEGADMGMWPIGSDCLKLHPELKPYVQEQGRIKANDWKALYADFYRQVYGESASDEEVMRDAQKRFELVK